MPCDPVRHARSARRARARRGFTVIELLTIFFVILVLAGILLSALGAARGSAEATESASRLRQIGVWSNLYTDSNAGRVLPSQFDDRGVDGYTGKARRPLDDTDYGTGEAQQGTWADILWTENSLAVFTEKTAGGADIQDEQGILAKAYLYDSPDANFFQGMDELVGFDSDQAVLRSPAANSQASRSGGVPIATPFGDGANEEADPGYFAANDFFNAALAPEDRDPRTKRGFWGADVIRDPSASLYAIDSFLGETIPATSEAWDVVDVTAPGGGGGGGFEAGGLVLAESKVDFRYRGRANALVMDGSVESVGDFGTLVDLEQGRGGVRRLRVRNLADGPSGPIDD